jgi:hypothetical protein
MKSSPPSNLLATIKEKTGNLELEARRRLDLTRATAAKSPKAYRRGRCAEKKITPAAALPCMVSEQLEKDAERKSNGRPPDKRVHAGHKNDTSRCGPLHLPSTMGEAARLPRRRNGLGSPCQSFYTGRSWPHHARGARSTEMPRGATPTAAIWRVRRASMCLAATASLELSCDLSWGWLAIL